MRGTQIALSGSPGRSFFHPVGVRSAAMIAAPGGAGSRVPSSRSQRRHELPRGWSAATSRLSIRMLGEPWQADARFGAQILWAA